MSGHGDTGATLTINGCIVLTCLCGYQTSPAELSAVAVRDLYAHLRNPHMDGITTTTGPLARTTDPDTSHEAAAKVLPGMEAEIWGIVLASAEGMTDDELCAHPLMREHHPPTVKTARSRLTKAGLVHDTGERRINARNRKMVVWAVTE